jgi:hypothetical protein
MTGARIGVHLTAQVVGWSVFAYFADAIVRQTSIFLLPVFALGVTLGCALIARSIANRIKPRE